MEDSLNMTRPTTPTASIHSPTPNLSSGVHGDDASFHAILGGVIAAVTLVLLCMSVALLRYKYRHNASYRTNEAKGMEFGRSADAALKADPNLWDSADERRKEYFI